MQSDKVISSDLLIVDRFNKMLMLFEQMADRRPEDLEALADIVVSELPSVLNAWDALDQKIDMRGSGDDLDERVRGALAQMKLSEETKNGFLDFVKAKGGARRLLGDFRNNGLERLPRYLKLRASDAPAARDSFAVNALVAGAGIAATLGGCLACGVAVAIYLAGEA